MHVSLSETVHDICRSEELIQILNRMGLCMSYNEVEQLDNNLALRTIKKPGVHRVPVPPSIQPGLLVQGAMDNFDHEENTKSGIGGSHDTILMLFQNPDKDEQDEPRQLSPNPRPVLRKEHLIVFLIVKSSSIFVNMEVVVKFLTISHQKQALIHII